MSNSNRALMALIPGQDVEITAEELCRIFDLESHALLEWVREGVLAPRGSDLTEWRFGARQFRRAMRACRLQRDLNVETISLPLVLDLLDELHSLRSRVRVLERHLID